MLLKIFTPDNWSFWCADLLAKAELYAEEAGVALALLAAAAGGIWWLRRQPEGSSPAD